MKQLVRRFLSFLVGIIPVSLLRKGLIFAAGEKASRLEPAEGLRFLFALDNALYGFQGYLSAVYDNGLHAKHRLIRYHDFFIRNLSPGDQVLDIGCGNGTLAAAMSRSAEVQITAMDIVPDNIDSARSLYPDCGVSFLVGDATRDIPEGSYGVVVLSNVLEHIDERVVFLRRIVNLARPNCLLVRVPLFERDWRVPLKKELGVEWRLDRTHFTEYTLEGFTEEVVEAGLIVVSSEVRWGEIWAVLRPESEML